MNIEKLDAAGLRAHAKRQFMKAYLLGALSVIIGGGLTVFMVYQNATSNDIAPFLITGCLILSLGGKKALSLHSEAHGLLYQAVLKE